MKFKLDIQPLSVNRAWCGRRFKTKEYKAWQEEFLLLIKGQKIEKIEGEVEMYIEWASKNAKRSDVDNPIKLIIDRIVEAGIIRDDRDIWKLVVVKKKTERAYIKVEIKVLDNLI